jgi:hypothetical protein
LLKEPNYEGSAKLAFDRSESAEYLKKCLFYNVCQPPDLARPGVF